MEIPFVNLTRMHEKTRKELDRAYSRIVESSAFILGKEVESFESDFSKFIGAKRTIGVASGTDALVLALSAMGCKKGDEVIVPAHTFVASPFSISTSGATPVFAEVDEHYCLSPDSVSEAISKKTKAVMPVHLYGQCADMESIMKICNEHDLAVIEDACQAHGSSLNGRNAGTFGTASAFSFYPGKNLGALGDGGAVCTSDDSLAEKIVAMRNYGSKVKYHHDMHGYNSRLDGLQAAFLKAKLAHLRYWNEQRRAIAEKYSAGLAALEENALLILPKERAGCHHVYHLFVVQVNAGIRDSVVKVLNDAGVRSQIHYPIPCHQQTAYAKHLAHRKLELRNTEALAKRILSLPIWPYMADEEAEFVIDKTREIVQKHNRPVS